MATDRLSVDSVHGRPREVFAVWVVELVVYLTLSILSIATPSMSETPDGPRNTRSSASGNPLQEVLPGIKEQKVNVLNSRHTLQRTPILEPDLLSNLCESLLDENLDDVLRRRTHIPNFRVRVYRQRKLSPNNQVNNPRIESIRPSIS